MKTIPALTLAILCLRSFAHADDDGFVDLLNGRDINGWVNVNCAPETWSVVNGVLTCTGQPIGALRTVRQYENFIFEAEWRHLRSGGNAGIFVWSSPLPAPGVPFLRSIEVQVLDHGYGNTDNYTTHGDVFPIHGSTMVPFGRSKGMRSFPSESRSRPSPEWNHYRVVANDGVVRLSVNGREVSGGEKCHWRKGYLGLESEGSPVEWRNLRLKELPSTGATPADSAPDAEDHRSLYTGVDLRGWKSPNPGAWKSNDWRLTATGAERAILESDEQFPDAEWIIDIKLPAGTAATDAPALKIHGTTIALPLTSGKFTRCIIRSKSGAISVQPAGAPEIQARADASAPAPIRIEVPPGADLTNLYTRPL